MTLEHERLLGEAFSANIINAYGSREFGRVAFSCPEGEGLCLSMEDFYNNYIQPNKAYGMLIETDGGPNACYLTFKQVGAQ